MESIRPDSTLPGEPVSQPSFNKMNQKDGSEVPDNMDSPDSNILKNPDGNRSWIIDGVTFPKGTKFRGSYKGYYYHGKVREGALMMNGKKFLSPNAAAITITRSDVDGWLFWDCKFPGASSWIDIYSLKQTK